MNPCGAVGSPRKPVTNPPPANGRWRRDPSQEKDRTADSAVETTGRTTLLTKVLEDEISEFAHFPAYTFLNHWDFSKFKIVCTGNHLTLKITGPFPQICLLLTKNTYTLSGIPPKKRGI